jgi:Xaa-Pro aminopeptidase
MVTAVSDAMIAAIRPGVTLADVQAAGDAKIPREHRKYMQTRHYFGHHIGLSVGDLSLDDAMLEPGMVFTVEPWYYNHDEQIAVFIEDDVLVTASGVENLTQELPRTPEALEQMTQRR